MGQIAQGQRLLAWRLESERLVLRPFAAADAADLRAYCGLWEVARMTSRIPHPYPEGLAAEWIASHAELQETGEAYFFCVTLSGELIGAVGLDRNQPGSYEIGYWIGPTWWGRGLASEAAGRVVRFAFEDLGAEQLTSGHFADNPASGRVLENCGFRYTGQETRWSQARGCQVPCRCYLLSRAEAA
jgi:RimJ/RimL family protein N-acetyltransferase